MKLYYNLDIAAPVTKAGSTGGIKPPEIGYRDYCTAELTVYRVDDAGRIAPADLSGILSWTGAVDNDRKSATDVMVRMLPQDFDNSDASNGVIRFRFSCYTQPYFAKTDGIDDGIMAMLELYGLAEGGLQAVRITVPVRALPLVDPDGGEKPPVPDGYATQGWVLALLNSGMELQYSLDGETWLDVPAENPVIPDAARWYRLRIRDTAAEWSAAIPIPHGAKGDSPRGVYFTPLQDDVERHTTCCWLNATDPEMTSPGLLASVNGLRAVTAVTDAAATGNAVVEVLLNGVSFTTVIIAATAELATFAVDFATPVSAVITLKRLLDDERDTLAPEVPLAFYDIEVLK